MRTAFLKAFLSAFLSASCVACSSGSDHPTQAKARIQATQGNHVKGTVTFTKTEAGLKIVGDFEGLEPGQHGFHIHEKGECSSHDGSSAGGHFNPQNTQHGGPADHERHAGDLGNISADEKGIAHYEYTDHLLTLQGAYSIIGRSVVIHADVDDYVTQPTGNSGARIGCGVIEATP